MVLLLAGSVAGMLANAAFNMFRFGTVRNLTYLIPHLPCAEPSNPGEFPVRGLVFSPSGGSCCTRPVIGFMGAMLLALAVRHAGHSAERAFVVRSALVLAAGLVFLIGLSGWFSPFGWYAWGPRLSIPLLPASAVAILHVGGDHLARATARLLAPTGGVLVAIIVTGGAGTPQFGMPWAFDSVVPYLVDPAPPCDPPADPIADDPAGYHACAEHLYWRIDPSLLEAATADDAAEARINQLVLAAATCGLILLGAAGSAA